MMPISDHQAIDLLQKAKNRLVKLAADYGAQSNWEEAHEHLNGAKQIDELLAGGSNGNGVMHMPRREPQPRRFTTLPHFYVEGDKLVKVGQSRDGGTYEHRVTKESYEIIINALKAFAKSGERFETQSLVDRCPIPKHEPGIVARVLEEHGLLTQLRRGTWQFDDRWSFDAKVDGLWPRIRRH